jgi:guanine deaminase
MQDPSKITKVYGNIMTFAKSSDSSPQKTFQVFENGALVHGPDGHIVFRGSRTEADLRFPKAQVTDHSGHYIMPGFIDSHLHYPQLDLIGSYGESLLGWLEQHTFPMESTFEDEVIARNTARRLTKLLANHGITQSVIWSSSHQSATDILFQELKTSDLRAIVGKVSMDQNCPDGLHTPADQEADSLKALISRWHDSDGQKLQVAITPRFAPACSPELLEVLRDVTKSHPELYVQTHISENVDEIALVKKLFPNAKNYADVYDRYDLLHRKTLLAHGIHLDTAELETIADRKCTVVHCPTSNEFLGSGLFNWSAVSSSGIKLSLASDIGGGTSLSPWRTMASAYQIQRLRNSNIDPISLLYHHTYGAAQNLGLENQGTLEPECRADYLVVNPHGSPLLSERIKRCEHWSDIIFALIIHGDDRLTTATYVDGAKVYG